MEENTIDEVVDIESIANEQLEVVTEQLEAITEQLGAVTEQLEADAEPLPLEEVIPSELDNFILENQDSIMTFVDIGTWWGFVGIPLVIIVVFFYSVYKEFLYTKI